MSEVIFRDGRAFVPYACEFCGDVPPGELELATDDYIQWQMGKSIEVIAPATSDDIRHILTHGHCRKCGDEIERLAQTGELIVEKILKEMPKDGYEVLTPEKFDRIKTGEKEEFGDDNENS